MSTVKLVQAAQGQSDITVFTSSCWWPMRQNKKGESRTKTQLFAHPSNQPHRRHVVFKTAVCRDEVSRWASHRTCLPSVCYPTAFLFEPSLHVPSCIKNKTSKTLMWKRQKLSNLLHKLGLYVLRKVLQCLLLVLTCVQFDTPSGKPVQSFPHMLLVITTGGLAWTLSPCWQMKSVKSDSDMTLHI